MRFDQDKTYPKRFECKSGWILEQDQFHYTLWTPQHVPIGYIQREPHVLAQSLGYEGPIPCPELDVLESLAEEGKIRTMLIEAETEIRNLQRQVGTDHWGYRFKIPLTAEQEKNEREKRFRPDGFRKREE